MIGPEPLSHQARIFGFVEILFAKRDGEGFYRPGTRASHQTDND